MRMRLVRRRHIRCRRRPLGLAMAHPMIKRSNILMSSFERVGG